MPTLGNGCKLLKQATAAGSSASLAVNVGATVSTVITRAAGDFVADGWTTNMWLEFPGSTLNRNAYRIKVVANSSMGLYDAVSSFAAGAVAISGHVLTSVAAITGITGAGGFTVPIADITDLDSTAKVFQAIPVPESAAVSLEMIYSTAASQQAMIVDGRAGTIRKYAITLADKDSSAADQPSAYFFDAYVQEGPAQKIAMDDVIKASMTLKISSAVKYVAKSS